MGFRNTRVEFINFFVQDRIAGAYLFLDDGRAPLTFAAIAAVKVPFVVILDKMITRAISISDGKSRISITFRSHPYMI